MSTSSNAQNHASKNKEHTLGVCQSIVKKPCDFQRITATKDLQGFIVRHAVSCTFIKVFIDDAPGTTVAARHLFYWGGRNIGFLFIC